MQKGSSGDDSSDSSYDSGPLDAFKNRGNPYSSESKQRTAEQNRVFEIIGYDGGTPVQNRVYVEQSLAQSKQTATNALASLMQKERKCSSNNGSTESSEDGSSRWKHRLSNTSREKQLLQTISVPAIQEKRVSGSKAL